MIKRTPISRIEFTTGLVLAAFILLLGTAGAEAGRGLSLRHDVASGVITVHRDGVEKPLVTQNAGAGFRPYLHPITSPDGKAELTQFSPGHHKHQTGLYWGLTRVNGRDFFHHPEGGYWRRVDAEVLEKEGAQVKWRTVYEMLDGKGEAILTERQTWTMQIGEGEQALLDLEWQGEAKRDVKVSKYDYGGLFLRMPWKKGTHAHVINAARHRDQKAEGKRAMWLDVGMEIDGLENEGHITIFDHPKNDGFPNAWRVDHQFGVGPSRARQGDWSIEAGKSETFRHRLVVYTGELNDKKITEQWSAWSGQKYTSALWGLAKEEGRKAKFLSTEEAVAAMTVKEGFEVNAFAAEPMITQPMAFCWDDRGRMWIAENRDYESRGRGFSNSGDSRILILEDTDRDGVADSRKVFLEGVPFPAGIAVGLDGLWLGAPPNLLFVPDRDSDDKADMDDIEVRLTGWGIRDRHETLNSFHWGPDGWLYGLQGFATGSKVGKPKGGGRLFKHREKFPSEIELEGGGTDINGGVWRYHPTEDRFEVVAHGFSNPWGLDYDAKGQLFITACVIPHLWHVIPGGIYHRQGGSHFNPHVYSDIKTIADHRHRSAHGGARVYLSDAFPDEYQGQLFMANLHEHAVLVDKLEPSGSGFIGRHGESFLQANNAQWIGFSMEIGPAGNVYVLDWHDADICGNAVHQKDTGRVFRIAPKKSEAKDWEGRYGDLKKMPDAALVELQTSTSAWHARRARVVLQGRAAAGELAKETHGRLAEFLATDKDPDLQLRALWCLHITGGIGGEELIKLLDAADQHIRAWAIQLLCEDKDPSPAALSKFAELATGDPSAVVRLYLASALQRIELSQRWPIAAGLVGHGEDADDHNLPKMLWFALEPMAAAEPERALALVAAGKIPMLQNYTARRAAAANALQEVVGAIGGTTDAGVRGAFLDGAIDGIGGRKKVPAPDNWTAVYPKLKTAADKGVAESSQKLAARFGDSQANTQMLSAVTDAHADISKRRNAIRGLAAKQHKDLPGKLIGLLDDKDLRIDAIRAMAAYEQDALADELLKRYDKFSADERAVVVQTLASRPKSGWKLALAIKSERVPRADIPAYIARQLRRVAGSGFVEIWGPIDELSSDLDAAFTKYRALFTDAAIGASDLSHGRQIYQRTCFACHKMYGGGGEIGPELTGSNRADLNYILDNILNPSGEIPEGYQMVVVTTRDGRTYTGNLASETKRQLTLRLIGAEPVAIDKADIQSRESHEISLMPAGLLSTLKDDEAIALIAYLRTTKQVPIKE